jgi:hypothetical protein
MAEGDVTVESRDVHGTKTMVIGTVELEASYTAGGLALTSGSELFTLSSLDFVEFELVEEDADECLVAFYDYTNDKVKLFEAHTGPDAFQEIGADNVSALVCRFCAEGRE